MPKHDQIRRVWAPRGVKVRQRVQIERLWHYLALAANPQTGALSWRWIANMKGATIAEAVQYWREQWDGARGHSSPEVCQMGIVLIRQPPYAPELDPVERIFDELRRAVEGRTYNNSREGRPCLPDGVAANSGFAAESMRCEPAELSMVKELNYENSEN